ncbi:unnamed protein product [Ranitomeya imitator]|uniref:Fucolectin tachylectin-4 pentraxin-1 domain-containing protein n=1 Tax=Ranitomeya imitator TaxID=111125 RepID=A0ABN9MCQ8_9NEOB|nr:unnamed protein product [Ranitomeya imitator]
MTCLVCAAICLNNQSWKTEQRTAVERDRMNLLSSLILLGSVVLTLGCDPAPRGPNIARNGIASQVSVQQPRKMGNAKNAIDGIKDVNYDNGSCILTTNKKNPWWKLDLIQSYKIWNVVLTNRMDCCPERLMGAEVRIGKSPNNNNPVYRHTKRRCSDTDNDPDRCSIAVWSLESCHTDRSPATNDPEVPAKTSLNRCHTRRFSDVSGRSSDEIKFWTFFPDQRQHSRGLIAAACHTGRYRYPGCCNVTDR